MNRLPPLQNSISSPLRIAEIVLGESEGRLGLTICPGKKDLPRGWDRDLEKDLRAMRDWGGQHGRTKPAAARDDHDHRHRLDAEDDVMESKLVRRSNPWWTTLSSM
jgi:hypothetical protein